MSTKFAFNPFTSNLDAVSLVTIGSPANGLSITGAQVLSIALSSTSTTGALSNTDWNTFNNKQATITIGALDAQAANANALALVANVLSTQSADATHPGVVNTTSQTFAGSKTFSGLINADGGIDRSSSGTLTIGATNSTIINIGNSGATVNIQGTTIYENTPHLLVADPLITVNSGGGAGSGQNAGIEVEENAIITGYAETSSDRNSWILKAPNTAGIATITPGASGITLNQSSHDPVTLGTANGLSLSTQVLSLALSSTSTTGALSSTDWNTFNGKQASGNYITALTGDGTAAGPGSVALTLATVNSNVGSFGSATQVGTFTVNGKGLITAASNVSIAIPFSQVSGTVPILQGGTGQTTKAPAFDALSPMTTGGDLIYGGASGTGTRLANGNAGDLLTSAGTTAAPTWVAPNTADSASTIVKRTSSGAISTSKFVPGITTVATAAGTTTVTVSSNQQYVFTGSTTQNFKLPVVTTLIVGWQYQVHNRSTGVVTVQSSGSNTVIAMAAGSSALLSLTSVAADTTAAPWDVQYNKDSITFDSLSPMTTGGDLIYGGASGTGTRLANGSAGQYLKSAGGTSAPTWGSFVAPTVQKFTTGSGTYTLPSSPAPLYIRVTAVGGGGGGAGSGTASVGAGGAGGNTTFGSTIIQCNGGAGAPGANGATGVAAIALSGATGVSLGGTGGGSALLNIGATTGQIPGGVGGNSYFGGGARGPIAAAGENAIANTGGGGGGGGLTSAVGGQGGGGGGAAGFAQAFIYTPSSTYAYAVGAGGTAGTAGTSGFAGGAGSEGMIIVEEFYQ